MLAELLEALPESGAAVLEADDEWTPLARGSGTAARVETVGYRSDAAHRITHVEIGRALHPEFTLDGCRFRVGLRGAHQVLNAAHGRGRGAQGVRRSHSTAAPRACAR